MVLKLATRSSELALIQTRSVQSALSSFNIDSEIVGHSTKGDRERTGPIYKMSKVGVFVEELNNLVSSGKCDAAVHSAKDMPSAFPDDLEVAAVLPRASFYDVLVSDFSLQELPGRSVLGTSSIRRISAIKSIRNDLEIRDIRGNIDTRLKKLENGEYDGILLAQAAFERMQHKVKYFVLNTEQFTPAPNQGIIAVVTKKDSPVSEQIRKINHGPTFAAFELERVLVTGLGLGCSMPVGILCTPSESLYHLTATFHSLHSSTYRSYEADVRRKEEAGRMVFEIKRRLPDSFGYKFR